MNDFEKDAKDFGLNDNRVTEESIAKKIVKEEYLYHEGGTLTICILTLQNGFTVRGESACADPANFRAELGSVAVRGLPLETSIVHPKSNPIRELK
jgi:hypothetical protein